MFPAGHFYSPLPDLDEVRRQESRLFAPPPRTLPGIALHEAEQLALLPATSTTCCSRSFPCSRRAW